MLGRNKKKTKQGEKNVSFASLNVTHLASRNPVCLVPPPDVMSERHTRHHVPLDWINTHHGREGGRRHVSGDLCAA